MATDERTWNFRSNYYGNLGFRNVEGKKSLDILMSEKPLDCNKLKQFCLRFTVPGAYRHIVWKVVLKVSPIYIDSHDFVMKQRTQVNEDLVQALNIMNLINDNTPKEILFLYMWLLESGRMKINLVDQLDDQIYAGFLAISKSLVEIIEDDVDIYWISKGFYSIAEGIYEQLPRLVEFSHTLLEKEDTTLFKHMCNLGAFDLLRLDRWFTCLFAGVLHEAALVKIWDKIVGGSYKILPFVAVVTLQTLRRNVLQSTTSEAVLQEIKKLNKESCEIIGNKSVELWQEHKSPLQIGDTRKEKQETS